MHDKKKNPNTQIKIPMIYRQNKTHLSGAF